MRAIPLPCISQRIHRKLLRSFPHNFGLHLSSLGARQFLSPILCMRATQTLKELSSCGRKSKKDNMPLSEHRDRYHPICFVRRHHPSSMRMRFLREATGGGAAGVESGMSLGIRCVIGAFRPRHAAVTLILPLPAETGTKKARAGHPGRRDG